MLNYIVKEFEQLSPYELYAILQLRNEVFAIEQNCVYPDMDNKDQGSYHLMGWHEGKLLAYTRLIPPGIAYPEPSIGRVVTAQEIRRHGKGKELMERSISFIRDRYGDIPIKISAQLYLLPFYRSIGFRETSEPYIEDHIEHIEMVLG